MMMGNNITLSECQNLPNTHDLYFFFSDYSLKCKMAIKSICHQESCYNQRRIFKTIVAFTYGGSDIKNHSPTIIPAHCFPGIFLSEGNYFCDGRVLLSWIASPVNAGLVHRVGEADLWKRKMQNHNIGWEVPSRLWFVAFRILPPLKELFRKYFSCVQRTMEEKVAVLFLRKNCKFMREENAICSGFRQEAYLQTWTDDVPSLIIWTSDSDIPGRWWSDRSALFR